MSNKEIPQQIIELGNLLASQHKSGSFSVNLLARGWFEVNFLAIAGMNSVKCRNLSEVRNVVVNVADEWLDSELAKKADRLSIAQLVDGCNELDLATVKKSAKTAKGITVEGIEQAASAKGYSIRFYKGYTYVRFPGNACEYKYSTSLLETAEKLNIISKSEAEQRYNNDARYGLQC